MKIIEAAPGHSGEGSSVYTDQQTPHYIEVHNNFSNSKRHARYRGKRKSKKKIPSSLNDTVVLKKQTPTMNVSKRKLGRNFLTSNNHVQGFQRKKKNVSNSKTKYSTDTWGNRINFERRIDCPSTQFPLYETYTSFESNDFTHRMSGTSQTFTSTNPTKNKQINKNNYSVSRLKRNKKKNLNRQNRSSSHNVYPHSDRKSNYNDNSKNLPNCDPMGLKSNELNINDNDKNDSELFFFDISGNRNYLYEASTPNVSIDLNSNFKAPVETTRLLKQNIHVEAMRDSEFEATSLKHEMFNEGNHFNISLDIRYNEILSDLLSAQKTQEENEICKINAESISIKTDNIENFEETKKVARDDTVLNVISNCEKKYLKKKRKNIETVVDIGYGGSEMSESPLHNKTKRKKYVETELNQVKDRIDTENTIKEQQSKDVSIKNEDIIKKNNINVRKQKEKTNIEATSSFKKSKRKLKKNSEKNQEIESIINIVKKKLKLPAADEKLNEQDVQILSDIRGSDCDINLNDEPTLKKRKKKKKKVPRNDDIVMQEKCTATDSDCEVIFCNISPFKKKKKEKKISPDKSSSFTKSKKSKQKCKDVEILGIGDSNNYEMNSVDVSLVNRKKKKKKKKKKRLIEDDDENQEENGFNQSPEDIVINDTCENENAQEYNENNVETSQKDSSFDNSDKQKKSKKKHNDSCETLVDIRDSDCELSVSNVSFHKKKKKKIVNDSIGNKEFVVDKSHVEEPVSDASSSKPSKVKNKHNDVECVVDLRDSDCEMSFNSLLCPKKNEETPKEKLRIKFKDAPDNSDSISEVVISSSDSEEDTKILTMQDNENEYVTINSRDLFQIKEIERAANCISLDNSLKYNKEKLSESELNLIEYNEHSLDGCESEIKEYERQPHISEDSSKILPTELEVKSELSEGGDEDKSDDGIDPSLDISCKVRKPNKDIYKAKDDASTSKQKAKIKSKFTTMIEKMNPSVKETDSEMSDILVISNEMNKEVDEDDIETLQNLNVTLPFPVPPLHSILTRTTTPSKEQIEKIKRHKLEVKTGPFSKEEDSIIMNNWKRFYKEHDLKANPSLFINFPRGMHQIQKVHFLCYLAHGLNNRMLHRVHARFKLLVQGPHLKLGRFTPGEDEIILNYLNQIKSRHPFVDLSKILKRPSDAILKRYDLLTSEKNETKINWTLEMVDKFVRKMLKVTKCTDIKQLMDRKLTEEEWKDLSKKMDNIPVKKLQKGWNITIYPRLFTDNVDLRSIKKDIIHNLHKRKESDWKTVNWKEIAEDYKGFTPEKLYQMFMHLVDFHVPEEKRKNLGDCLDFLKNVVLEHRSLPNTHKFKKFKYKEGHIVYESKNESE